MIKHISLFLLAVIMFPVTVMAQMAVGDWRHYPVFQSSQTKKMIETPSKLYYLSGTNLFSFDTSTEENYAYSTRNVLSDGMVNDIYYNDQGKYLVIAYRGGNIDVLYDNGKVVNMSDIKDAIMTTTKEIRGVTFGGGYIIISTDFGLVKFDEKSHSVKESGIYTQGGPTALTMVGDRIMAIFAGKLYTSPVNDSQRSFTAFTPLKALDGNQILGIDDKHMWFSVVKNVGLRYITFNDDYTDFELRSMGMDVWSELWKGGDGNYYVITNKSDGSNKRLNQLSASGQNIKNVAVPETLTDYTSITTRSGFNSVWTASASGIGEYDISAATPVVKHSPFLPEGSSPVQYVGLLTPSPDGNRLYVHTLANSVFRTCASNFTEPLGDSMGVGIGFFSPSFTSVIENGTIRDITVWNPLTSQPDNDVPYYYTVLAQEKYGKILISGMGLAENPLNPDEYFLASLNEGLFRVKDAKTTDIYGCNWGGATLDNCPNAGWWAQQFYDVKFDPEGNLWVLAPNLEEDGQGMGIPQLMILPAAKVKSSWRQITKSDWVTLDKVQPVFQPKWDGRMKLLEKSPVLVALSSYYRNGLLIYNHNGTYTNTADDHSYLITNMRDQDGNALNCEYLSAMAEDKNGHLWVATMNAFFEIQNPGAVNSSDGLVVNRFKVPRNDGTNYADYLLPSEVITDIAVDGSNRKWVATQSSGLYLVNEDGSEVLEHFTADNSYLPTNEINCVYADPHSNSVFIGTNYGLMEYSSDSSPASENFDNVYAYPNPVRPDYTGWITINGLMDNSLVKITDASGALIYTGTSNGGMMMWDGCNMAGRRVKSGVYYVMASTGGDDMSSSGSKASKIACKIMVVN